MGRVYLRRWEIERSLNRLGQISASREKLIVERYQHLTKELEKFTQSDKFRDGIEDLYSTANSRLDTPNGSIEFGGVFKEITDRATVKDVTVISTNFEQLYYFEAEGHFATLDTHTLKENSALSASVERARMGHMLDVSEFWYSPKRNHSVQFVTIPLMSNGRLASFFIVELVDTELQTMLSDYEGLGGTGEIMVGQKMGDDVVLLGPLRHDPDATFHKRASLVRHPTASVRKALEGDEHQGVTTDYRGEPVVASWHYLPAFAWGLVAKQDIVEAIAPSSWALNLLLILGILFGLFAFLLMLPSVGVQLVARSTVRGCLVGLFVLGLVSSAMAVYFYVRIHFNAIQKAQTNARGIVSRGVQFINRQLLEIESLTRDMTHDLSVGRVISDELNVYLERKLMHNANILSIKVMFTSLDKLKHYSRGEKHVEVAEEDVVQLADQDNELVPPQHAWYLNTLEKGAAWYDFYEEDGYTITAALYAAPFFDPEDVEQTQPAGVIACIYALDAIKEFVGSVGLGKTGYGFVITRDGQFVHHSLHEYVHSPKTILDVSGETSDPGLRSVGEKAMEGKGGFVHEKSGITQQGEWIYFEPVARTGWTFATVFIEEEVVLHYDFLRRIQMWAIVAMLVTLLSLILLLTQVYLAHPYNFWRASLGSSIALGIALISLWFLFATRSSQQNSQEVQIFDEVSLTKFITEMNKKEGLDRKRPVLPISTGIFLYSLDFPDLHSMQITGYVWQKYDVKKHKDIERGFFLPQASKYTIREAYRSVRKGVETIGWKVSALFFQEGQYEHYPFDVMVAQLLIESNDKQHNVILVPDIDSYTLMTPSSTPGIDDNVSLSAFKLEKSFFSYQQFTPETDFGIKHQGRLTDRIKLKFNAHLRRNPVNPFMVYLLPLLVVLFTLFALLRVTETRQYKDPTSYTSFQSVGPYSALLFPVVIMHQHLRGEFPVSEVLFMEYFFFITFLTIFLLIAHGVALGARGVTLEFRRRSCMMLKYLFWPAELTLWLLTSIAVFY